MHSAMHHLCLLSKLDILMKCLMFLKTTRKFGLAIIVSQLLNKVIYYYNGFGVGLVLRELGN